jgi:hypothetical protein
MRLGRQAVLRGPFDADKPVPVAGAASPPTHLMQANAATADQQRTNFWARDLRLLI